MKRQKKRDRDDIISLQFVKSEKIQYNNFDFFFLKSHFLCNVDEYVFVIVQF